MKKNYKKYGPTSLLWALYLIVGAVAFFVSNFYFKFEFKDAIIFGVVNLVVVVVITEGIDWIFKKAKSRKEHKAAEKPATEEVPSDESVVAVEEPTDKATELEDTPVRTDGEVSPKENLDRQRDTTPVVDEIPETEENPVADDELPMLITGRPGAGKNFNLLEYAAHLDALKEAESTDSANKEFDVDTDAAKTSVESPVTEDYLTPSAEETITEPVASKPRGRRANPEAIIDAPTSSMPIITPDMIKPKVEPAVEPVVAEPVVEKPYLSANDFLDSTKLTSPRAIVREYQRLGGKDDIYSILAERQK